MTDLLISGLLRRRSEMAADISHLTGRAIALQKDMAKLDAALSVLGHEVEGEFLPAKKATTAGLFRAKELPRLIYAALRANEGGLEVAQIAEIIIRDKGWETDDKRFVGAIREKISRVLWKVKAHGNIVIDPSQDGRVWRIV